MAKSLITKGLSNIFRSSVNCVNIFKQLRHQSTSTKVQKLLYTKYGDPIKVVEQKTEHMRGPQPQEILVKMLAAPINPADINTIQGKYPVKPILPSVPGNEGIGEVVAVGDEVTNFAAGDRVVPLTNALGTWRTHIILKENNVIKVPKKLGLVEGATITVNPCTAYRMLKDFTELKPGDSVIQNGANSAVGQNVIQLCREWGIRTVNIVRDRDKIDELKDYLRELGATEVLTEEELSETEIFKSGRLPKPRLALNCVGGPNAMEMIKHVDKNTPMVTYGGMSRQPVLIPTGSLIFKDVIIRGFWMTRWNKIHGIESAERKEMLDDIINLMVSGKLQGPAYAMVPFNEYKEALSNTMSAQGMIGRKYILDFNVSSL